MSSHRIEIIKELRALEQSCSFRNARTGEENERFLKDYLADIDEYPIEAIKEACADWRKSGSIRFPTSGQLIPIIKAKVPGQSSPREDAWRQLDDAAYAQLDLPAKERHHLILANQCEVKAGPMWKNGRPLTAEQMPPAWHRLREQAQFHRDEAVRLRKLYRKPPPPAQMAAE
jgi:hypothetical protein